MKNRDPFDALAVVAKAFANPRRLELIDLLVQGPWWVDSLANAAGQSMGNASQHLQVLKRAGVVQTSRYGTRIEYRLGEGVAEVFVALRRLGTATSPGLSVALQALHADVPHIEHSELAHRLTEGSAVLLDVRPAEEHGHAHIPGALSIPIGELEARLVELPVDPLIVATCRGPFCVYAVQAVRLLRASGRDAVCFRDGVAEWIADGHALIAAAG